jgi:hypothetical protein
MGIPRPSPALVAALEARLAPRITALIVRTLTKRVVAQCFASSLLDAQGSSEGSPAPALTSSPKALSCDKQEKAEGVAGAHHTEAA